MKIDIHIGTDTFAEAACIFAHLQHLDEPAKSHDVVPHPHAANTKVAEPTKTEAAKPVETPPAEAKVAEPAGPSLDDVKAAFRNYVGRGGGRTAATAKAILEAHGLSAIRDAKPEQHAVLVRAFETAGPENPLGEAA